MDRTVAVACFVASILVLGPVAQGGLASAEDDAVRVEGVTLDDRVFFYDRQSHSIRDHSARVVYVGASDDPRAAIHFANATHVVLYNARTNESYAIERPSFENVSGVRAEDARTSVVDGKILLSTGVMPFAYDLDRGEWVGDTNETVEAVTGSYLSQVRRSDTYRVASIYQTLVVSLPGYRIDGKRNYPNHPIVESPQRYDRGRAEDSQFVFPVYFRELGSLEMNNFIVFAIEGDTVFVTRTSEPGVTAYNLSRAEEEWFVSENGSYQQLVAHRGSLVALAGLGDGEVRVDVLSTADGTTMASYRLPDARRHGVVGVSDRWLVVAQDLGPEEPNRLVAYDRTTGERVLNWTYFASILAGPETVYLAGDRVLAFARAGKSNPMNTTLHVFDLTTGEEIDAIGGFGDVMGVYRAGEDYVVASYERGPEPANSTDDARVVDYFGGDLVVSAVGLGDGTVGFRLERLDGDPVADARVTLGNRSKTTDSNGTATFDAARVVGDQRGNVSRSLAVAVGNVTLTTDVHLSVESVEVRSTTGTGPTDAGRTAGATPGDDASAPVPGFTFEQAVVALLLAVVGSVGRLRRS